MPGIILILFFSLLLSFAIDKDIEEVLPPFVFTLLTGLYFIAILGKAHHSFFLSLFGFAAIWIFYIIKKRRFLPSVSQIKEKFSVKPVGFIVYIVLCTVMFFCYRGHFVLGWDDLHFNATFAKDMYYYGTMPTGTNSATHYRDYLPLLQLFYYWGFQSDGAFSESLMFCYKIILMYTCLLPLFRRLDYTRGIRRICTAIAAVILPYACLYEILDSLSMDAVMALIFAYVVISIMDEGATGWFRYYRIISGLFALVLIKSISLMFTGICLCIWLCTGLVSWKTKGKKERISSLIIFMLSSCAVLGARLTWIIFCRIRGNSTYLSKKLAGNIPGPGFSFPSYSSDTAVSFLKGLYDMRLNDSTLYPAGICLSVATALLACFVSAIIIKHFREYTRKDLCCHLILLAGLVVYAVFLLYTYLFLFEEWEAETLSSYDRYFGTYVLTLLTVLIYRLTTCRFERSVTVLAVLTVLLFCSLDFGRLANALVPSLYMKERAAQYSEKLRAEHEVENVDRSLLKQGRILVVNNSGNDCYSRYLDYDFILMVSEPYDTEDIPDDKMADCLIEKINDRNTPYVYFTEQMSDDPHFHEMDSVLADKGSLQSGIIYYFDSSSQTLHQ